MDTNPDAWGEVIDLDDIAKASRGAEASYEDGLLDFLADTLGDGRAAAVTRLAVVDGEFDSPDDIKNAKQTRGAMIRKHVERLVVAGRLPKGTKVSINWHPITGVPQVSLRT